MYAISFAYRLKSIEISIKALAPLTPYKDSKKLK